MNRKLFLLMLLMFALSFMVGCNAYKGIDKAIYGEYDAEEEKQIALLQLKGGDAAGTEATLRRLADANPLDKELQYYAGLAILKNQGLDFIAIGEKTIGTNNNIKNSANFASILGKSKPTKIAEANAYLSKADTTEANVLLNLSLGQAAYIVSTYLNTFDTDKSGNVSASEITAANVASWNAAQPSLLTTINSAITNVTAALNDPLFKDVDADDKADIKAAVEDIKTDMSIGTSNWTVADAATIAGWDD